MARPATLGLVALALGCGGGAPQPTEEKPTPDPVEEVTDVVAPLLRVDPGAGEAAPDYPDVEGEKRGPCGASATNLPTLLQGPGIRRLEEYTNYGIGQSSLLATSYLPPSGPYRGTDPVEEDPDPDMSARDAWGCKYAPGKAFDRDATTAWCEGVAGSGEGQVLVAPIPNARLARIGAGYQKSEALRTANGRPRRVKVTLMEAREATPAGVQSGEGWTYRDVKILGAHEVELEDRGGWQPLPLPEAPGYQERAGLVAVEILSVYPGGKYEDTCISEIEGLVAQ
ncbi:MAG: hypothetical protein JRJ84_20430 [Deltaproteobacteria bacterium]|nr:hypothetical protein [Deltaproteobacteria bacterium]